jgi:hypothetical protein
MTIDLFFYRTTYSSNHAGLSHSYISAHAQPPRLIPTTSRACYKTPTLYGIPAHMSESLLSLLCTLHYLLQQLFPSIAVVVPPSQRQTGVFAVVILDTPLSFAHYSSLSFPLAQQFPLNCCCTTPRRSNYGCLLRKISLFRPFAAVVKSPCTMRRPHLCSTTLRSLQKPGAFVAFFAFTLYFVLSTQYFFCCQPCGAIGSVTPQNRHFLPVLSPSHPISATPPLPPQQKSEPSRFAFYLSPGTRNSILVLRMAAQTAEKIESHVNRHSTA